MFKTTDVFSKHLILNVRTWVLDVIFVFSRSLSFKCHAGIVYHWKIHLMLSLKPKSIF